jgi:O-methyltransferase
MPMQTIARELLRPFRRKARKGPASARSPRSLPGYPADFAAEEIATIEAVAHSTMTSPERIVSLVRATAHVARAAIPGDFVECGVWKGGSMMAVALTLQRLNETGRTLHLFDTFQGMPAAGQADRDHAGRSADENRRISRWATSESWCLAGLEEVRKNMQSTDYPSDRIRYIAGRVEATIPAHAPEKIALLRLDTDWYESTRHELEHLYPRLVPGGVLIFDDYGYWQGVRQATDEYIATLKRPPLLCRIDACASMAVKPE